MKLQQLFSHHPQLRIPQVGDPESALRTKPSTKNVVPDRSECVVHPLPDNGGGGQNSGLSTNASSGGGEIVLALGLPVVLLVFVACWMRSKKLRRKIETKPTSDADMGNYSAPTHLV